MLRGQDQGLKHFMLLLVIVLPLFFLGLSNHGLWSADEPRVAEIGREMALSGNWVVPMLNQRPFLEQPPLYYAMLAVTFKVFGVSDKVARIPSALFALGGVVALFFLARFLFGARNALVSALVLATTGEYFRVAHTVVVDSALTFFVICGMGFFMAGYLSDHSRRKLTYYILLYASCSLAFLVKGFIGIVIPGLGILAFLFAARKLDEILKMRLWLGVLIFLAMTGPWFVALWHQGGTEHLKVFLVHNHVQRFLPGSLAGNISGEASGHHHPFYYYLTEFPIGFLPWSILLIPVMFHAFRKPIRLDTPADNGRLFALCWFLAGLIFLSVASTKRVLYLMPIFAPVAMLTSLFIQSTLTSQRMKIIDKIFLWVLAICLLLIGLAITPIYIHLKRIYPWIAAPNVLASGVMLSLIMMAFSLAAIRYLWRGDLKRYWIANTVPIVAGLIVVAVVVAPLVDRHKSFVPFCEEVMALVPHEQTLFAYKPDETLRGAIPFYTGRYLVELWDLNSVERVIQAEEPFFVITRDKRREAENELLSTGRLSIIFQQKAGIDRTLTVFKKMAPDEPK